MAKNRFLIEDAFKELVEIIAQMEDPELPLSDSMDLYKKGMKLLDRCSKNLDKTEKEIQILQEGQHEGENGGHLVQEDSKD